MINEQKSSSIKNSVELSISFEAYEMFQAFSEKRFHKNAVFKESIPLKVHAIDMAFSKKGQNVITNKVYDSI